MLNYGEYWLKQQQKAADCKPKPAKPLKQPVVAIKCKLKVKAGNNGE
jgi:hypothetical protein